MLIAYHGINMRSMKERVSFRDVVPLALCASAASRMIWMGMGRLACVHCNQTTAFTPIPYNTITCQSAGKRRLAQQRCATTMKGRATRAAQGPGIELGEEERARERQDLDATVKAVVEAMPGRPKCAVVGGGFGGLATAYHLAAFGSDVTVFDPNEVGTGGASSVAAGLLHPLTPRGKRIWKGEEGLSDARDLIEMANAALAAQDTSSTSATIAAGVQRGGCITADRVYRPLMDDKNDAAFSKAAKDLPQWVTRLTPEEYSEAVPGADINCLGGVLIQGALALDAQAYLKGLWSACCRVAATPQNGGEEAEPRGAAGGGGGGSATWVRERVDDVHALAASGEFHAVVACVGPGVKILPGVKDIVSLRLVRGQSLIYDNIGDPTAGSSEGGDGKARAAKMGQSGEVVTDEGRGEGDEGKLLTSAVLCGQYIVPTGASGVGNGRKLVAGATQEPILYNNALDKPPDMAKAVRYLSPKITGFFPALQGVEPREVTAGVRVIQDRNSYGRIPIAGRLPFSQRGWVLAALGARGLIHHAYLGRLLAACALLNSDEHLPPQVMAPLEDLGKDSTGDL